LSSSWRLRSTASATTASGATTTGATTAGDTERDDGALLGTTFFTGVVATDTGSDAGIFFDTDFFDEATGLELISLLRYTGFLAKISTNFFAENWSIFNHLLE
jgi:hypothetical protein